jgi:predicted DCC family thiol-disulfide oxidoreductase YuxK
VLSSIASVCSKPGSEWAPEPVMMATGTARDAIEWMTSLGPDQPAPWIVLYDADCGFCRWSLSLVLGLDRRRRLVPVALGTAAADDLLADLSPDERERSWHLVAPSGERTSAGAGAPPLLRLLPGGRGPAGLLAGAPALTERAYRWVADHRSTLSRAVPSGSKRRATERIARHARR